MPEFIYSVGRRKESSARVRLYLGKGENVINGKSAKAFSPLPMAENTFLKPLQVTDALGSYYFTAKVLGGGISSQIEAVGLGIARALAKAEPAKFKPLLRKFDLLTRDPRARQRRMVGTGGKSRRKKQSPKR